LDGNSEKPGAHRRKKKRTGPASGGGGDVCLGARTKTVKRLAVTCFQRAPGSTRLVDHSFSFGFSAARGTERGPIGSPPCGLPKKKRGGANYSRGARTKGPAFRQKKKPLASGAFLLLLCFLCLSLKTSFVYLQGGFGFQKCCSPSRWIAGMFFCVSSPAPLRVMRGGATPGWGGWGRRPGPPVPITGGGGAPLPGARAFF